MITHLLADPEARRPGFPQGGPLDFDYAVAVKTGTSQGYRDAWAVALSDRLLVVTWVGNHDQRKMGQVSGGTGAAPATHDIMEGVMPMRAPHLNWAAAFPPPTHWVPREVCPLSGKLAGPSCTSTKTEYFAPGTEPRVVHQTFQDWREGDFPLIYQQDFLNVPKVQKGMKSRGFKASRPSPIQERAVGNFHRALRRFLQDPHADDALQPEALVEIPSAD